jgi:hypothetical protein
MKHFLVAQPSGAHDFNLLKGKEEFEDIKVVIRIRKSTDRQQNGQKNKQRSTKHYAEI